MIIGILFLFITPPPPPPNNNKITIHLTESCLFSLHGPQSQAPSYASVIAHNRLAPKSFSTQFSLKCFAIKVLLFLFQVHVAQTSNTADHCLAFALSDPVEKELQDPCDHPHDKFCLSCGQLKTTMNEIKDQIKHLADKDDDLLYCYHQAAQAIESWKSHLLR